MLDTQMLIGGAFVTGTEAGESVINPKTGDTIATIADASAVQVDLAVAAAEKAFRTWSRTTPGERANLLF